MSSQITPLFPVSGTDTAKVQGIPVSTVDPVNGQVLVYKSATLQYEPDAPSGGLGTAAYRDVGQQAGNVLELSEANKITIGDGHSPSGTIVMSGPDGDVYVSNDTGQLTFNDSEAGSITLSQIALTSQIPTLGTGVATALAVNVGAAGAFALGGAPSLFNAGNITGTTTLNLINGANQKSALTGDVTLQPPTNPVALAKLDLQLTASGANRLLSFDGAILIPSDSAISFPKTLTSAKTYLVSLRYINTSWVLTSLVGGY